MNKHTPETERRRCPQNTSAFWRKRKDLLYFARLSNQNLAADSTTPARQIRYNLANSPLSLCPVVMADVSGLKIIMPDDWLFTKPVLGSQ